MNTVVGIVARRHFEVKDNSDENTEICKLREELLEATQKRGQLRSLMDLMPDPVNRATSRSGIGYVQSGDRGDKIKRIEEQLEDT